MNKLIYSLVLLFACNFSLGQKIYTGEPDFCPSGYTFFKKNYWTDYSYDEIINIWNERGYDLSEDTSRQLINGVVTKYLPYVLINNFKYKSDTIEFIVIDFFDIYPYKGIKLICSHVCTSRDESKSNLRKKEVLAIVENHIINPIIFKK